MLVQKHNRIVFNYMNLCQNTWLQMNVQPWPMECANEGYSSSYHGVTENIIAWNHRVIGGNCVLDYKLSRLIVGAVWVAAQAW